MVVITIVAVVLWRQTDWHRQRHAAIASGRVLVGLNLAKPTAAPGLLRLFGESGYNSLLVDPAMNAQEIQQLRSLFPETAYPYGRIGEF
ncbi:MAG: hypothetical protein C0485_05555 [Pirellula sp.]|nr:hypothetical protein [Pirellula sp.]